jgi:outer membrane protein TolC
MKERTTMDLDKITYTIPAHESMKRAESAMRREAFDESNARGFRSRRATRFLHDFGTHSSSARLKVTIKHAALLLLFPMVLSAQTVQSVGELFDSLKSHSATISDEIRIEQALAGTSMAYSKLYPNIDLFGRYDYASIPTSMVPVPPNELLAMVQHQTVPQPFSERISRLGATVSMPIFVASIFTAAAKAKLMYHSAEDQKYINLLKNEAIIVSADANLLYMQSLQQALEKKKNSLMKTRELVVMKVENGRAPASALLNINNALHQIDVLKNDIALQQEEVLTTIQSLTGIRLTGPVPMEQVGNYSGGEMKALDPLRKKLEADRLGLSIEKEKLWPLVAVQGSYSKNFADAYNNGKYVDNDYLTIGLIVKVPLFAMDQYTQIEKSSIDVEASENELDKMTLELTSQVRQLENSLLLLKNSLELYQASIKEKEELLTIAKVSYASDQMSVEDYLKYEDDVVLEQSKLFKTQAQHWQTLVKLAVIHGNNIEEIVK